MKKDTRQKDERQNIFLTVAEAADFSRLSQHTIRNMINDGTIHAFQPRGRAFLVDRNELENYIRSCVVPMKECVKA